ncbi:MAG: glycosyltransferase [bacterium]|nr:glycosyltransferase [bacterium]
MKLSICCITYNQVKFISEAVESFLMQKTTFPIEIIVGDDSSTDGTSDILRSYSDPRLTVVFRGKNLGGRRNLMDIISRAKGEYISICEGDDFFTDPLKLQKQVDFLEKNKDCSMCFHPVKVFWEDGSIKPHSFPESCVPFLEFKALAKQNYMQINSVVYRWRWGSFEEFKKDFGYTIIPGDHYLHLLHAEIGKVGFLPDEMASYRKHPKGRWYDTSTDNVKFWSEYGLQHLELFRYLETKTDLEDYRYALLVVGINTLNAIVNNEQQLTKFKKLYPDYMDMVLNNK